MLTVAGSFQLLNTSTSAGFSRPSFASGWRASSRLLRLAVVGFLVGVGHDAQTHTCARRLTSFLPLTSLSIPSVSALLTIILEDPNAAKVATIYNTRGDKVNDSTAKFAYSETKEQEIARFLVNRSEHLGQDNVEVLSNSVSASSHKLTAFSTISSAIETSWKGGPGSFRRRSR